MPNSEDPPIDTTSTTKLGMEPSSGSESSGGADVRTFLIADVRGYTKYTQEHGDEAAATLASTFADLVREVVEARQGFLLELRGDEALVVFVSARQALRAAVELQARFAEASLPRAVGIGLDAGEAVQVGAGYRGGALNLAARLCAQAGPGQILASEGVIHLAAKVDGLAYVDPRTFRLKGYAEPVRAVEVVPEERARRGPIQRVRFRTQRAARRPLFWAAAAAVLTVIVVLAVVLPGTLGGKGSPATGPTGPALAGTSNMLERIDPVLNRVVASIPVGKAPSAVTTGSGSVWVTNSSDDSVSRIDPVTNKVIAVIRVGIEPLAIGFDGTDIWVANRLGKSLSRIDPGSDRVVATVPVETYPVSLAFDGGAVFAGGSIPCCPGNGGISFKSPVLRLDPASEGTQEVASIQGSICAYVAAEDGVLWSMGDFGEGFRLGASGGRQTIKIDVGARTIGVLVAGEGLWVAVLGFPGEAALVDPTTLRVTATVPVGSSASEKADCTDGYVSMAEANGFLWVTNPIDGTISQIDVGARRGIATVNVGKSPTGIAVAFGSVWVTVASL